MKEPYRYRPDYAECVKIRIFLSNIPGTLNLNISITWYKLKTEEKHSLIITDSHYLGRENFTLTHNFVWHHVLKLKGQNINQLLL